MAYRFVDNDGMVFFAKKGYYKGAEVTVTHRDPETGNVWLEDYKGKGDIEAGCWVNADSVKYKGETNENHKRRSKQAVKKVRR